jgi:putative ABC transport system permease protein
VTVLLIGLVFAMAANERMREIGLLRAMGATRGFIFRMIIGEALVIAGAGALIGLAVSIGIMAAFARLIALTLEVPLYRPGAVELAELMVAAAVLALLTGAAAAFIPAAQLSRLEPYEAIRRGE